MELPLVMKAHSLEATHYQQLLLEKNIIGIIKLVFGLELKLNMML